MKSKKGLKAEKQVSPQSAGVVEKVVVARGKLEGLQAELVRERKLAARATEEAARARLEREEYRRVLAAAIANERKSLEAARESAALADGREADLLEAIEARGAAEGRASELARELDALRADHERAVKLISDQAWADSERHGRELQRSEFERGVISERVRDLTARVPVSVPTSAKVGRARARIQLVASGLLGMVFVILVPELLVALLSRERGVIAGAADLTPTVLLWIEVGLLAMTLLVSGSALRALRGAETLEEAARVADEEVPGETLAAAEGSSSA